MITRTTDFVGEIFIPNLINTGPGARNTPQNKKIDTFIEQYESECLNRALGHNLAEAFLEQFEESGNMRDEADQKWKDLLEGASYEVDGQTLYWEGIKPTKLIARYVFFHFIQNQTYSGVGIVQENTKNAETMSVVPKAIRAWRNFYASAVGNNVLPKVYENTHGVGIDWMSITSAKRSLYQFIADKNRETETYPSWEPYLFENMNEFGI